MAAIVWLGGGWNCSGGLWY